MNYKKLAAQLKEKNPFMTQSEIAEYVIRKCILNNDLLAGEKINQEYFGNMLEMSRSPIREALNNLEKSGYVMKAETSGYVVYKIRLKDYIDFFEFRIRLESYAAYLAARTITDEQLLRLKTNLKNYIQACDGGNREKMKRLDCEFHDLIVEACDNYYLIKTYRWMLGKRNLYLGYFEREGRLEKAKKGHIAIYRAIEHQDEEMASKAVHSHLKYYLKSLYDIL